MKIFNWVHRRFIPKEDTAALLLERVVPGGDDDDEVLQLFRSHNYDGWGGARAGAGAGAGILSIGTFGLDKTLGININPEANKEYFGLSGKDDHHQEPESDDDHQHSDDEEEEESDHHDDVEVEEEDDDDDDDKSEDDDCEKEWNPLVYDKSGASRPAIASAVISSSSSSSINNDAKPVRPSSPQLPDYIDQEHIHNNYSCYRRITIDTKKEKERITLADLFSADSDDAIWTDGTAKNNPSFTTSNLFQAHSIKKKAASAAAPHPPDRAPKNGTLLFPKKLVPLLKQDSRPIQKLHGLMKRMLKRKIHPDVVAAGKNKSCAAGNGIPSANHQFGINESVSLLRSQGKNM